MKMFIFDTSKKGELKSDKCGSCNWDSAFLFWMSDSRENALKEIHSMNDEGNALCGTCMCELLATKGYKITEGA